MPLLLISVVLAGGVAFVSSILQPKVYEAQTTLLVGQALSAVNPDYSQLLASQRLSGTYASVATTRPLLNNVIAKLNLQIRVEDLAKRITASAPLDSTLLILTARDGDPDRAAALANTLAAELIAASPALQGRQEDIQASIDGDLKATEDQISATQGEIERLNALRSLTSADEANLTQLQSRLVNLRATHASLLSFLSSNAANLLSVVEPAISPDSQISPRPLLNLILGGLAGLFVSAALVFVAEYFDDTLKTAADVEEVVGLPTLATISRIRTPDREVDFQRLVTLLYPRSANAEDFRTLRTNIGFASIDAPIRSLVVTSPRPGEGKTVTASNLAVVFAQSGQEVLLVDADMRNPAVHTIFATPNDLGFSTLLRSDDVSLAAIARMTDQATLRILTSGPPPPNPAELLGSKRMRIVFDRLLQEADLVIFDSPPALAVADPLILSSIVDGTVLVVDVNRTRRGPAREAREALARAGATVLGAILNGVSNDRSTRYAQYYDDGVKGEGHAAGGRDSETDTAAILARRP